MKVQPICSGPKAENHLLRREAQSDRHRDNKSECLIKGGKRNRLFARLRQHNGGFQMPGSEARTLFSELGSVEVF
jgi:hypothetical protein